MREQGRHVKVLNIPLPLSLRFLSLLPPPTHTLCCSRSQLRPGPCSFYTRTHMHMYTLATHMWHLCVSGFLWGNWRQEGCIGGWECLGRDYYLFTTIGSLSLDPETNRLHFPASLAVGFGHVTSSSQWKESRSELLVYVYNRIFFSNKKRTLCCVTDPSYGSMNLKTVTLSERSQAQETTYCIISFT